MTTASITNLTIYKKLKKMVQMFAMGVVGTLIDRLIIIT